MVVVVVVEEKEYRYESVAAMSKETELWNVCRSREVVGERKEMEIEH